MKPRTYFRVALLFPYLLWVICALIVFIFSQQETSTDWSIVLMPVFYYAFGILLWFIPYTLLASGMWIWSRNKPAESLFRAGMSSPFLLGILMIIEGALVYLPDDGMVDLAKELPGQIIFLGGLSLVFGYLCVGIALGIYKLLKAKKIISEEVPQTASTG